jgi:uncharacterized protein YukJ
MNKMFKQKVINELSRNTYSRLFFLELENLSGELKEKLGSKFHLREGNEIQQKIRLRYAIMSKCFDNLYFYLNKNE